jgi:hypothetical protein
MGKNSMLLLLKGIGNIIAVSFGSFLNIWHEKIPTCFLLIAFQNLEFSAKFWTAMVSCYISYAHLTQH